MKYECIIFDCDGVLVDSEEISIPILVAMANKQGANIDIEYAKNNFIGASLKEVFKDIEVKINKELPLDFESDFRKKSFELFKTDLQAVKGVHKLLQEITIPICVASNGPLEKIKFTLTTTNLLDKFDGNIFSAYEIKSWKPDPGLFLYAAKKMGVEPKNCLVIEDSLSGIKAAVKGGFDVFGFTSLKNKKAFEKEGAWVFSEMSELLNLIETRK